MVSKLILTLTSLFIPHMKKHLLFIILVFFALAIFSITRGFSGDLKQGGIFISSATVDTIYYVTRKDSTTTNKVAVGKTYHLSNDSLEFKLEKDQSVEIHLSNDILLKLLPETTFFIDNFNYPVFEHGDQPEEIHVDDSISSFYLLEGEIHLIVPKISQNSQSILQTPLVNVVLTGGEYLIRANSKYTTVKVVDGSLNVVGSSGKDNVIVKGNLAIAVPLDAHLMVAQKEIELEEFTEIKKSIIDIKNVQKNVLFVIVDGKVIGIRLK
jgi:hypothetical protein